MLLDSQNLFSDEQSIIETAYSTNIVKFGKGEVCFVPLLIQVVEDFDNLTSLKAIIETSDDSNFETSKELASASLALEDLKAGNTFNLSYLPKGNLGYMRIKYEITGTAPTTGKITAGVVACTDIKYQD